MSEAGEKGLSLFGQGSRLILYNLPERFETEAAEKVYICVEAPYRVCGSGGLKTEKRVINDNTG